MFYIIIIIIIIIIMFVYSSGVANCINRVGKVSK